MRISIPLIEFLVPNFQLNFLGSLVGGLATTLIGGALSKKGAGKEAAGQEAAIAEQKRFRGEIKTETAPYREAGVRGLSAYEELLTSPEKIKETPGYEFRLTEGLRGVRNVLTSKGKLFSGRGAAALERYGQDYATAELDKELQRRYQLTSAGLSATGIYSTAGTAATNAIGQSEIGKGQAQAAPYYGAGNIFASLGGDILGGIKF